MARIDTRTEAERISADFWDWFGPRLDAHAELRASMPERDEESRTILGEEMLDIEFEPVTQVPEQAPVLSMR